MLPPEFSSVLLPHHSHAGNYIHDMLDAGFAILESMDADIHDNVVENVKYGIRISLGGSGNQIYDNSFDSCSDCK